MNGWAPLFLGVIAVATLATAIVQIAVLIAASRLARRLDRLTDRVERELQPIAGHLKTIGQEASRAAVLATAQVERADRLFADVAQRLETLLDTVQSAVGRTAREGAAIVAGFRAAVNVIRDMRARRARSRADDEDALFI